MGSLLGVEVVKSIQVAVLNLLGEIFLVFGVIVVGDAAIHAAQMTKLVGLDA